MYGCEAWAIGKRERRREAFEMWYYRKVLIIIWVGKLTNEVVLSLVKKKRSLYSIIKRHRDILIGRTLRHKGLVRIILEGTVGGHEWKGRQILEYAKQIIDYVACSGYCDMDKI